MRFQESANTHWACIPADVVLMHFVSWVIFSIRLIIHLHSRIYHTLLLTLLLQSNICPEHCTALH